MGKALGGARIAPTVAGVTLAAITLALALALSGCVSADPAVTPQPQASATPLFASDAEALKAAEEAYTAYLKVSDQILADGGANPERIEGVAVRDALAGAINSAKTFRDRGYKSMGSSKFENVSMQRYSPVSGSRKNLVSVYGCLDVSGVDVVDASGLSVVSAERPARQSFELSFDRTSSLESSLVLASQEPWLSDAPCN